MVVGYWHVGYRVDVHHVGHAVCGVRGVCVDVQWPGGIQGRGEAGGNHHTHLVHHHPMHHRDAGAAAEEGGGHETSAA